MDIIVIVFIIFLILLILSVAVIAILLFWSDLTTRAPFVPIPKAVLPAIVEALAITPESEVWDLGCGDGRVLLAMQAKIPKAKYIGADKDIIPYWLAKFRTRKIKGIEIKRQNFLRSDLSNATHIFAYLFPVVLSALLPKLRQELKPGARLVSCDFIFTQKEPVKVINLNRPKGKLGRFLYVYEF